VSAQDATHHHTNRLVLPAELLRAMRSSNQVSRNIACPAVCCWTCMAPGHCCVLASLPTHPTPDHSHSPAWHMHDCCMGATRPSIQHMQPRTHPDGGCTHQEHRRGPGWRCGSSL
jgi:hypothetical protein